MNTGDRYRCSIYVAKEAELLLIRNNKPEMLFIDFVYEPVQHFDGSPLTL
jgi:hypothetical protein